jgi:hypothetical protein
LSRAKDVRSLNSNMNMNSFVVSGRYHKLWLSARHFFHKKSKSCRQLEMISVVFRMVFLVLVCAQACEKAEVSAFRPGVHVFQFLDTFLPFLMHNGRVQIVSSGPKCPFGEPRRYARTCVSHLCFAPCQRNRKHSSAPLFYGPT